MFTLSFTEWRTKFRVAMNKADNEAIDSDGASRNMNREWNQAETGDGAPESGDDDSAINYNFMERKEHPTMYNSMQKTTHHFDGNSLPSPGDMFNSTGYDMKHRSQQKP